MTGYFSDKGKNTHTRATNDLQFTVLIYRQKSWLTGLVTFSNWPAAIPGYKINIKQLKSKRISQDVLLQTALEMYVVGSMYHNTSQTNPVSETLCFKKPMMMNNF